MNISMIAVLSANGKISRNETSPIDWNSREDLKWFKEVTSKIGTVVMGRRTYEIIGHPLKKRLNIVMSKGTESFRKDNLIFTANDPQGVIEELEKLGIKEAAIIGGKSVFTQFLKKRLVKDVYLTYEPIFIKGIDLFDVDDDIKMEVISVKNLKSGAIVVHLTVV